MSYIVGTFHRHHTDLFLDTDPFYETEIVDEITKEHLVKAKDDNDYQVINLITREYYDPIKNQWVKINRKS